MLTKIPFDMFGKIRSEIRPAAQREGLGSSGGFTLIELMIVMVIVAIGVTLAVPTFENIAQKRQTTSEAEQLAAFLGLAQSEAIKRNEEVSINLTTTSDGIQCVGLVFGTADCDCIIKIPDSDTPPNNSCHFDGILQYMNVDEFSKSSMLSYAKYSSDSYRNFTFDPVRGFMTTADLASSLNARTFLIESTSADYQLQVEVSVVGQIRIVNSDCTKQVPGYPGCP
jgi:type IV fimbrial biogenesis protein FimT